MRVGLPEISLAMDDGHVMKVRAIVYGEWAAHRSDIHGFIQSNGYPEGWRVTHIPTGMSLAYYAENLTVEDAAGLALELYKRLPLNLFGEPKEHVVMTRRVHALKRRQSERRSEPVLVPLDLIAFMDRCVETGWIIEAIIAEVLTS